MASSSVSQESLDLDDFDNTARRNRIRVHRGHSGRGSAPFRGLPDRSGVGADGPDVDKDGKSGDAHPGENGDHTSTNTLGLSTHSHLPGDHESPTRSAAARLKDKRTRPNHMKGKLPKDKRKLREKRRSTGVVHCMPSTESTGDSLDDDDDDEDNGLETKKNTNYNESTTSGYHHQTLYEVRHSSNPSYSPKRNKSPSDLEADLEDNQDYDSTVSHSETNLTLIGRSESYDAPPNSAGRQPGASPSSSVMGRKIGGLYAGSKYSPESRRTFQFSNTSNVNLGGSSGADSPSRNTLSSTSSSSSVLSRHRELDSPRSVSGGNSNSVFGSGNAENVSQSETTNSQDPASPRLAGNTGLESSFSPSIQPRPVGFSVFKEANSGGGAVGRSEKPSFSSTGYMSSSRFRDHRDRDNERAGGGGQGPDPVHSRVSGFHHHHHHHHQSPRPFTSSLAPSSSALVQQKNENITQLEKQLEKEREENKRLKQEMEEKDKKIAELQKSVELLNNECDGLDEDNLKLQEENKALIRAMSKLSQNA